MVINHVSENLIEGIKELTSFNFQLDFVLKELGCQAKPSNSGAYSGYYLNFITPGIRLWVGIGFKNPTLIKIQITNKELISYFKQAENYKYDSDPDSKRYIIVSSIDFIKDSFFMLSANEQKDKIREWLVVEIAKLKDYLGNTKLTFSLDE